MEHLKRIFLMLFLLASIAFSAGTFVTNITACGSYSITPSGGSETRIANFTTNIVANVGATVTNGACVYIAFNCGGGTSNTFQIQFNNKTLTQNGSTATYGLYVKHICSASEATVLTAYQNYTVSGFNTSYYLEASDSATYAAQSNYRANANLISINATNILRRVCSSANTNTFVSANLLSCGTANLFESPFSYCPKVASAVTDLSPISGTCNITTINSTTGNILFSQSAENATFAGATGASFLYSNKLFSFNSNLTTGRTSLTTSGNGTRTNFTTSSVINSSINSTTSANLYLYARSSNISGATIDSTTTINSLSGKVYYCIGGLCNPLTFANYTGWPFYINAPDMMSAAEISNSYTNLNISWVQGFDNFLVASSSNSEDSIFYLQPNGHYIISLDNGTNVTSYNVTNSCPNIFTVCSITLLPSSNLTASPFLMPSGNCSWSSSYNVSNVSAANVTCCASSNKVSTLTFIYSLANGTNISNSFVNSSYCDTLHQNVTFMDIRVDGVRVYSNERPFVGADSAYGFLGIIILVPLVAIFRRPSYVAISFSLIIGVAWMLGVITSDFGFIVSVVAALAAAIFYKGGF